MTEIVDTRFQFRRGTAAQWAAANPVLLAGEPGVETDTGKEKRGDGVTAWSGLPYHLNETALSATYGFYGNVLAYGAKGDGVTDDSAAFATAFADWTTVYAPARAYLTAATITVPAGKTLIMEPAESYSGDPTTGARIIAGSAALTGAVLSLGSGASLYGGAVIGGGKNANAAQHDGILLAGNNTVEQVTVTQCRYGINGNYSGVNKILACMVHQNWASGLRNVVDSEVLGGYYSANGLHGIDLAAGANDNSISSVKCEWNDGYGFILSSTADNTIAEVNVDRNGKCGFRLTSNSNLTIALALTTRNGRLSSGIADDDAHFYNQSNTNLTIIGVQTAHGGDDGGGGYDSPTTTLREDGNTNYRVLAGNLTGCTSATPRVLVNANTSETVALNDLGGTLQAVTGHALHVAQGEGVVAANGGTFSVTANLAPLSTSQAPRSYRLDFSDRNGAGNVDTATVIALVHREGGTGSVILGAIRDAIGAAFGMGGGTLNISASVNADASVLTVTVTNADTTNARTVRCAITALTA